MANFEAFSSGHFIKYTPPLYFLRVNRSICLHSKVF